MQGHKATTKKAEHKKVGHTTGRNYGQSDSVQSRGVKSGTGSAQSYK